MMKALVAVALASVATVSTNASAAVLTYDVNGVFSSGQTLTGSFSFDPNGGLFSQFTNFDIQVSGFPAFDSVKDLSDIGTDGLRGSGDYEIGLERSNGTFVDVDFTGTYDTGVLKSIDGPLLNSQTRFSNGELTTHLVSGTITSVDTTAPAGAVPEPATWAMMILGMGAVGYAMRSAKRRSDAKFDAKIKRITYGIA